MGFVPMRNELPQGARVGWSGEDAETSAVLAIAAVHLS